MVRTICAVVLLILATLFLPFWAQIVLYILAVIFVRHRTWLFLPALFADAWYAPTRSVSLENNKTFLIVLGLVVVYFLIISNTRIAQRYGLEKN